MIKFLDLHNQTILKELFELQRAAYLIEANLINFFEIPPLIETIEQLKVAEESFLGYFEKEQLAGALSYTVDGGELDICRMVVHPDFFRKGIGQSLLNHITEAHQEITLFKVSTGRDNHPAKSLYLKNGFKHVNDIEVVPGLYISSFEKR